MFAYCGNNPVMNSDPAGKSFVCAIILAGAIIGGALGAFSAASTGGNIVEGIVEGVLTGTLGAVCGMLISNPVTAVAVALLGGATIDVATQMTMQYISTGEASISQVDPIRSIKTGCTTALGVMVPQFGSPAANACDAFETALIWAECSALITCADVVVTNYILNSSSSHGITELPRQVRQEFSFTY